MADPENDPVRDSVDELLGGAVDAVPEGDLKRFLKQAGWIGLIMGVFIGTVPWAVLMKAGATGKASLGADAIETYFVVFVLFLPFVVLFAIGTFMARRDTSNISVPIVVIGAGLAWWLATIVSFELGGAVPAEALTGPDPGPSGAASYIFENIGLYIEYYGVLPVLAGPIEGAFLGYWASILENA